MRLTLSHLKPLIAILLLLPRLLGGWQDDIGLAQLRQEAEATLPDGSDLSLVMVEAWSGGAWAPDSSHPSLAGRPIAYVFSDPKTYSPHASEVARRFFGSESALPAAFSPAAMDTSVWLTTIVGDEGIAPLDTGADLVNHSWVSWSSVEADEILKRTDYLADAYDIAQIVSLDNSTAFPSLLANSYNAIVVGTVHGRHSQGGTNRDGIGRLKPDLVAPAAFTSYAAPIVSTVAGLLLSRAKAIPELAEAGRTETLKALLLAGAAKDRFPDWSREIDRPLDQRFGAGEVNARLSYRILERGRQSPGAVTASGWDFRTVEGPNPTYRFEAPAARLSELSVALAWNRTIEPRNGDWSDLRTTLRNLDLRLWTTDALGQRIALVDASASGIDNVEHIWRRALPPGRYLIEVETHGASAEYGLAWRIGDGTNAEAANLPAGESVAPSPTQVTVGAAPAPLFLPAKAIVQELSAPLMRPPTP